MSPNLFFNNPGGIATVITMIILLIVGITGFYSILGEGNLLDDFNQNYTVTDRTVNKSCEVGFGFNIDSATIEQILTDGTVITIDSNNYTYISILCYLFE